MKKIIFTPSDTLLSGQSGHWWHDGMRGPLSETPFIRQFGNVKISKINIDENMGLHINNGIEIHYIKSGKHNWIIENEEFEKTMYPGDLSITAPWTVHGNTNNSISIGHICWIVITPDSFGVKSNLNLGLWTSLPKELQVKLGKLISNNSSIVLSKMKYFEKYFDDITLELLNQKENYRLKVINIIEIMLIDLCREMENYKDLQHLENNFVQLFSDVILNDLAKKWEVDKLAQSFGMGKTMFTEKIKNSTGFPPKSYIINLRITEAKKLLKQNKLHLTSIADSCGFSSLQHFTKTFKQRTGKNPGEYRSIFNTYNTL